MHTLEIPPWVNSNHENYRNDLKRIQEIDAAIKAQYALDYGEPLTAREIFETAIGGAVIFLMFDLLIIFLT